MIPRTSERRWVFAPADREAAEKLAPQIAVSPVLAQLLINRGLRDAEAARRFLRPDLRGLHDPLLLPGVAEAAARIALAVRQGERIVIYGDFDVDGVSAVTILLGCFELAGGHAEYYLPDREEEGYGLNCDAIRSLAQGGARLIVTVDCGVNAVEEARLARSLGVELIITDHHKPGPELPSAFQIINPHLADSPYPFNGLSGAGVAFKLAWAIAKDLSRSDRVTPEFREFLMDALGVAALGSIADVVPLRGENRIIAKFGLEALSRSERPGLRALRRAASINEAPVTAWDVAFRIAPRLNAAGRLGSARRAVELLTTRDEDTAEALAGELEKENSARRAIQDRMIEEALAAVEEQGGVKGRLGLALTGESWRSGVVGIVAGRIADRLARPTVAIALDGDEGHGSARSGGLVDVHKALSRCSDLLISFGGHEAAAGLRIARDNIPAFRQRFQQALAEQIDEAGLTPTLDIEMDVALADLSEQTAREINLLAPFGAENERPVFAACGLRLTRPPRRMGAGGRHLSFWVARDGVGFRAVAFGWGDLADDLDDAGACSIAYSPTINDYRGRRDLQLDVKDIKLGETI